MSIGYVFKFNGYGAFDPDGKVEMADSKIKAHNRALAESEVKAMSETGHAVLYHRQDGEKRLVGTWDGLFNFPVSYARNGRHNMAGKRLDVWFTGPDGKNWHGVNIGDNDIVRCKRVKGGAR